MGYPGAITSPRWPLAVAALALAVACAGQQPPPSPTLPPAPPTPTAPATAAPIAAPTATPTPTAPASAAPTAAPTLAPTPTATATAAPIAAPTLVPTPTATATATPAATPTPTLLPPSGLREARLTVGAATFIVEIADTPAARSLGLGGRDALDADRGMWFVFDQPRPATFWMRGMRFPLDIIWVTDELVVASIAADVPPPEPGTPDSELPRYRSNAPVRYVLELNAGHAALFGIAPGANISVEEL